MLSNKLTFSLVFVVMLAFVLVATPAIAQVVTVDGVTAVEGKFIVIAEEAAGDENGLGTLVPPVDDVDFPNKFGGCPAFWWHD